LRENRRVIFTRLFFYFGEIMKIFLPFIFLLISFECVSGCARFGNPDPPLEYIASKTEKIFLGEVISKTVSEEKMENGKNIIQSIKFRVIKAYKGIKENEIEIKFYEKKLRKSSCDEAAPKPEPKEKWMIFEGYDEGDYVRFVREAQWLSFKFNEEIHKDFTARLEKYTQNPPTAIYGQLNTDCMLTACEPMEGTGIKILGEYIKFDTKTDKDGRFSLENIPPGKYKITIYLPNKMYEWYMNWGSKKETIFDTKEGNHIFEHETNVRFRDADYNYFVFDRPSRER
jgi:hypothetical protein